MSVGYPYAGVSMPSPYIYNRFGAPIGRLAHDGVVYNGFGEPVGLFPAIAALAAKVLPAALPLVTQAVSSIIPGPRPPAPAPAHTVPSPTVRFVSHQHAPPPPPPPRMCPPPTIAECQRLFPICQPMPRRRRSRIVQRRTT